MEGPVLRRTCLPRWLAEPSAIMTFNGTFGCTEACQHIVGMGQVKQTDGDEMTQSCWILSRNCHETAVRVPARRTDRTEGRSDHLAANGESESALTFTAAPEGRRHFQKRMAGFSLPHGDHIVRWGNCGNLSNKAEAGEL